MRYWPGATLEDFVRFIHSEIRNKSALNKIIEHYEPLRQLIEKKLQIYSEIDHGPFNEYLANHFWSGSTKIPMYGAPNAKAVNTHSRSAINREIHAGNGLNDLSIQVRKVSSVCGGVDKGICES